MYLLFIDVSGEEVGLWVMMLGDLEVFWKKCFVVGNVVFVVVGDFDCKKLLLKLKVFLMKVLKGKLVVLMVCFEWLVEVGDFIEK